MSESLVDRRLPPVTELGAAAMAAIAGGVVYEAAYLPKHAPSAAAFVLLAVAAALELASWLLLARVDGFAWWRFRQVFGYGLAAYVVIGGMIEYAFLYDHTHGTQLVLLTLLLTLFILNVPLLMAFTVARYQRDDAVAV
ncbi:MAG TPA: hypothetical protein VFA82_09100 [Gaiellaceae bacterium]|nr:hypothetical protein [Gaiellaceae bacterium]